MIDPALEDPAPGAEVASGPAAPSGRAGRILLTLFGVYAVLVLVAAFAQLTDDRALLDLFDLRRWFTK